MFKDSYKIILIKEGKFSLKQFSVTPRYIFLAAISIIIMTSSLFIIFSEQFVKWTGSQAIERHRKNNEVLIETIDGNLKRFDTIYAAAGHPYVVFGISFHNLCLITKGEIKTIIKN